jgi:hypothetical protein
MTIRTSSSLGLPDLNPAFNPPDYTLFQLASPPLLPGMILELEVFP